MDVDAANKLQDQIRGSREKHIYFLLTAAGACIGYSVEKVAGLTLHWKLVVLAVSMIAWGISFWFGCNAVKRDQYGLQYNHAWLTAARSATDKQILDSLMTNESRASACSSRWQFRFFVIGGVAFVLWRLLELLPR